MLDMSDLTLPLPITGAVLAGGQSARMGTPKAGVLLPDGRPMIAHVLDALSAVCHQVVVIGHAGIALPDNISVIPDQRSGLGPLAGLEALLASKRDERYLVVSCDQPLLTPELLYTLASQTPCSVPGFFRAIKLDPFPGVYPGHLLGDVQSALDAGRLALHACIRQWPVHWVAISPSEEQQLHSMNTPADIDDLFKDQVKARAIGR